MEEFLSAPEIKRVKFLGLYQALSGALGIFITIWALAQTEIITGIVLAMIITMLSFYSFSIYAGKLLINDRYEGLLISMINQSIQILNLSFAGMSYKFVSGSAFFINLDLTKSLSIKFEFNFPTFLLSYNRNYELSVFGVNIVAIILLLSLNKIREGIKEKRQLQVAQSAL
ncbi:hypothetical protein [Hymenobacter jejuensis]|uniref:Uncharacterized protein n=1 Tax=Hymenobacter jejuensis TaxID=2502781 RepID=A0A5B8A5J3_9BACT|nr:hypothetical protein [Hymenobacter jejuensis]QDA61933.1 hypothetical protein FHG12_18325 [Hymenobacter jejuensis]